MDYNEIDKRGVYVSNGITEVYRKSATIPCTAIFLDPWNDEMCKWFKRWRWIVKIEAARALYDMDNNYLGEIMLVQGPFAKWFIKRGSKYHGENVATVVTKAFSQ